MQIAPVISRTDPLPAEILGLADEASHRAGDMLMQTSGISLSLRRAERDLQALTPALAALAEEARLFAQLATDLGLRIGALQARAAS